jgi:hypothetical protein
MAPAVSSLRIITPCLDHPDGSVACKLSTWAMIVQSPLTFVLQKLNWSAVFQMSAPPPATVHTPAE